MSECEFDETLEIIGCIAPVVEIIRDTDIQNMTRARALRVNEQCNNITRCLSPVACAVKNKLDKTAGLLCEAFQYFSTDFFQCQKNITKQLPPCIRKLGEHKNHMETLMESSDKSCELMNNASMCFKQEITNICGEEYWRPIKNFLVKLTRLGDEPCKLQIEKDFD